MGTRLAVAMLICSSACQKSAPPKPPELEATPEPAAAEPAWAARSPNSRAVLEARNGAACSLACLTEDKREVWTALGCLVGADDLAFVTDDCTTALLVYPLPKKDGSWANSVVLRVLRDGVIVEERRAREMPGVDFRQSRFRWLSGAVGEFGTPPRYSSDGTSVELELKTPEGRKSYRVRLGVDEPLPAPAALPAPPPPSKEGLYRWVDESGGTQISQGLKSVPERFRQSAVPLTASVGVLGDTKKPEPEIDDDESARRAFLYRLVPFTIEATDGGTKKNEEPTKPDLCARAAAEVAEAERAAAAAKERAKTGRQRADCLQELARGGEVSYAMCMATGSKPDPRDIADAAAAERKVQSARDDLRRVQIAGCN